MTKARTLCRRQEVALGTELARVDAALRARTRSIEVIGWLDRARAAHGGAATGVEAAIAAASS